jgi:gamma-glutamyltranspeptidase / glutathione hydrolase
VTEPCNTGIGGDCFALFYDATTKTVKGLNGSGRSAKALSVEELRKKVGAGPDGKDADIPLRSPLAVTVPGAAAGWVDVVDRWGSGNVTRSEVLQPAIDLAEQGFPVTEVAAGLVSL